MTDGTRANRTGRVLESQVEAAFRSHGYVIVKYPEYRSHAGRYIGQRVLLKNVPYTSIYRHRGYSEFVAIDPAQDRSVRIECKWQQSPGSVDEKFPYVYLNAVEAMTEPHVIIIVDGGGAKADAVSWLRRTVEQRRYRDPEDTRVVQVMDIREFIVWANNSL